ncbi:MULTISPECIES: aminotransferase class V-fold PLP-dependent enzyme [Bacillus amyloliquefaciens group]|uniref:aminotransferase class V-fold PLP-dependent enzyme n=1 Tax=Bacillus amyloliquefaciens group TaxID=1938374 RepID=UPI00077D858C|nr:MULTISPECIES: aminotransferase class V-fold PLP-dependent enzyme [Bacillus amyloliquefaciens group]AMQ72758.1 aminotransferase [Bacillus amyloliquefaciens UMAF6614]AWM46606.1 aminotransferase class V-fold PLP-dependent enzyme [Bacillus amyloliquefaciens]MBF6667964.1 aminotransferase class V-fold PLP-dependent enzyme [Bacillus velezensis]
MNSPLMQYRSLFPALHTHTMLASCSQSALALPVSKAINDYQESLLQHGGNWEEAIGRTEQARCEFAKLIGAHPEEIAVLPSVTAAVSAVVSALPDSRKKQAVYTELDFPAIAHILKAQTEMELSVVPSEDGMIPLERYETYISEQTLFTCVPHVSYTSGFVQDMKRIAEISEKKGSLLFVDAYQSAGHIPIDVKEWGVDMLAAGARKYMLGIPGTAFLYVRKELAERLKPKVTGWFGQQRASMLDLTRFSYADGAKRFETGTPAFISIYAAQAALSLLNDAGTDRIHQEVKKLSAFAYEYASEKGLNLTGPPSADDRPGMISIRDEKAAETAALLRRKNIVCAPSGQIIRLAPHFYNTADDLIYAIDELAEARGI